MEIKKVSRQKELKLCWRILDNSIFVNWIWEGTIKNWVEKPALLDLWLIKNIWTEYTCDCWNDVIAVLIYVDNVWMDSKNFLFFWSSTLILCNSPSRPHIPIPIFNQHCTLYSTWVVVTFMTSTDDQWPHMHENLHPDSSRLLFLSQHRYLQFDFWLLLCNATYIYNSSDWGMITCITYYYFITYYNITFHTHYVLYFGVALCA